MNRHWRWGVALTLAIATAGIAGACGGGGDTTSSTTGAGTTTTGSTGGGGMGDGGSLFVDGGGELTLSIEPANPILDVTGTPTTLPLIAKLSDGSTPTAVNWLLDDVVVGTLSTEGVFQSQGFVAGKAQVTAQVGELTAKTTVTVRVKLLENPGNLSPSDQALLEAGGAGDPNFRWLYPYDRTVFPRGLDAPSLQFGGGATDAMLIKIAFGDFEYKAFYGAANPARVALPAAVWKGLTTSAAAGDQVKVEATKLSAGFVAGPISESWRIAQGSLKGVIYYNTYVSKLANGGAVMRVRPGQSAEVLIGGCTVCHSVSAQGKVLAAGVNWGDGDPLDSSSFNLLDDGTVTPRYTDADGRKFAFGALTPDGAWLLSNGVPTSGAAIRGLSGPYPSKLYDTTTGAEIPSPSLSSTLQYAVTPAFSPDGKRVAFNWHDKTQGRTLAVMDVDAAQSPPAFSNLLELAEVPSGVLGWPSFLPDGNAVLYHEGERFDTAGYGATPSAGEVKLVDVATKAVNPLGNLNGYDNGQFYLPYGEAEEAHLDYEPSVLPVPVGGYYWVFFTSRRAYGNTVAPGGTVPGGDKKWGEFINGGENPSPRKKIWIAAIDLDYANKPDPSHPALYLEGQELEAGNMRAFAALEPCKADGSSCESAAECCGGFCRQTGTDDKGAPILQCVPPPGGCSHEDEPCQTAADCCDVASGMLCINGHCAQPTPQ